MTEYISRLRDYFIVERKHHEFRQPATDCRQMAKVWQQQKFSDLQRATKRLVWMLEQEKPVVLKDETIALLRTVPAIPEIFTEEEFEAIRKEHYIHEQGKVCNVNPLYSRLIDVGFDRKKEQLRDLIADNELKQDTDCLLYTSSCLTQWIRRIRNMVQSWRVCFIACRKKGLKHRLMW